MANNLVLKSKLQVKTDILTKIIALLGLNDVNPGSVLDVLSDAIAQEDFAQYVAMAQIARLVNLDEITGSDLDAKAFEYGLTREPALAATGLINILRPQGFVQVSTTFYAGSPAPIKGNTTIDVNDASSVLIGSSGTLILGYGTANYETVTYSSAPVNYVNFWRYTVSPLANNHSIQESVVLSQGADELVQAGTTVNVPATGTTAAISFTTDEDVVLPAGFAEVDNVSVTAVVPGSSGNISTNQLNGTQAFPTPPFTGARAINPAKFTTGADRETDDELKDSIRNWVQSLSRGVQAAIKNAIIGLVDPVTAKRVVSANVILPQSVGPVLVYIDDGTGFEPSFQEQGYEDILDSATGKKSRLQLNFTPVVKAQLQTASSAPYNMSGVPLTLTYTIGTLSETITFQSSDFEFANQASAYEIVAAINNKATLIEARTANGANGVVINAIADVNENIQVTGGSANAIFNFPTAMTYTLSLYRDDKLLSKDGSTAIIQSANESPYNFASLGSAPWPLNIVVDGKTANPQVVNFQTGDFVDPTSGTVAEVVTAINARLAGALASSVNNSTKVQISSNTLLSLASILHVTGGAANSILGFPTSVVSGSNSDYTFNRELGTIELNTPAIAGENFTVGSLYTRAYLRAATPETYNPTNGQTLVIVVDGGSPQTITFDSSFTAGQSASYTATFINAQLVGATAISRSVEGLNYLEIGSNSQAYGVGSIEILSSSTGNGPFAFTTNTTVINQIPNRAYQVSSTSGPWRFAQNDTLVVVLDDDIINKTYSIQMSYASVVSSSSSTTSWTSSSLPNVFGSSGVLVNYYTAFTSGANTTAGVVSSVTNVSGNTWQYNFASLPLNLASYAIGDLVYFSAISDNANNGYFVITGISTSGNGYVQVSNPIGVADTGQSGAAVISQCRRITSYSGPGGIITVGSAFSHQPAASDPFIVIPSTVSNVVGYVNNIAITSFSLYGYAEGVNNNTQFQLSSQSNGSDGFIQITGGQANLQFQFPTNLVNGLAAYNYYTGLLALVHKTIYGDDTDLETYPGVGAAGIVFYERGPTVYEVEVTLETTLAKGITLSSIQNSIQSAVSGYINNLGVGDEVVIEEIRSAVIQVPGVTDVVLKLPLANIPIAQNQLARTKSSLITIS